jgi:hypothetical protein
MPIILSTQEVEIRRIMVGSQTGKIVPQDSISKNPSQKIGLVEWFKVKALSSSTVPQNKYMHK